MAGQILWAWMVKYYLATGALGGLVTYQFTKNTTTAVITAIVIIILFKVRNGKRK